MSGFQTGEGVDRLLAELHEKKLWLDQIIAGLEAAVDSPQHRLIAQAAETFEAAGPRQPKVDLKASKRSELQNLAERVGTPRQRARNGRVKRESKA